MKNDQVLEFSAPAAQHGGRAPGCSVIKESGMAQKVSFKYAPGCSVVKDSGVAQKVPKTIDLHRFGTRLDPVS